MTHNVQYWRKKRPLLIQNYLENLFISEKFSVIYISKEEANFISLLNYI